MFFFFFLKTPLKPSSRPLVFFHYSAADFSLLLIFKQAAILRQVFPSGNGA